MWSPKSTVRAFVHTSSKLVLNKVGFGTNPGLSSKSEMETALKCALESGYTMFDFAEVNGNQATLGKVIRDYLESNENSLARKDLFFIGKLWCTNHGAGHPRKSLLMTLNDLHVDQLDMFMIHWPAALKHVAEPLSPDNCFPANRLCTTCGADKTPLQATWSEMEELVDSGLTHHIGLCNVDLPTLRAILATARIRPAAIQIEMHLHNIEQELLEFCLEEDLHVMAHSPLGGKDGSEEILLEDTLVSLASKFNVTKAQVALRWAIERGVSVIVKSDNPPFIRDNIEIFNMAMSWRDIEKLNDLNRGVRYHNPYGNLALTLQENPLKTAYLPRLAQA